MMMKTTLSAATRASPEAQRVCSGRKRYIGVDSILARGVRGAQWHRHSCLCAFATPTTLQLAAAALSLLSEILIANLELEFKLSSIRINDLKFSNRKFFTIFYPEFQPNSAQLPASTVFFSSIQPLVSSSQDPWTPWRLIVTPRLELLATSRKQTPRRISNVTKCLFSCRTRPLAARPLCKSRITSCRSQVTAS